ncbi:MAG: hypothetical protein R3A52_20610 [Polyangiales bacterium]
MRPTTSPLLILDSAPDDPDAAAWAALADTIDAIDPRRAPPPNVNALRVAWKARLLVEEWSLPPIIDGLRSLPATTLDPGLLPRIEPIVRALTYANLRHGDAVAVASKAQVDPALMREAYDTRRRMIQCASLFFGDAPGVRQRLRFAATGKRLDDLIRGLHVCASLYEEHRADRPREDFGQYRADDRATALRLAEAMVTSDRANDDVKLWSRRVAQAWALLRATYEPLRAAVTFLQGPSRAPAPTLNQLRVAKKPSRAKKG